MEGPWYGFSGSDFVSVVNGKVYGEIISCRTNSLKKLIELDLSIFSFITETEAELRAIKNGRIMEVFGNEQGDKLSKLYCGVKYIGYKSNHSLDDAALFNTFIFEYESDTPFSKIDLNIYELIKKEEKAIKTRAQ